MPVKGFVSAGAPGSHSSSQGNWLREWARLRRQAADFISTLKSFRHRRRLTAPLRQLVARSAAIPDSDLVRLLGVAFAQAVPTEPRASIIIPVFNKFRYTARCLLSLAQLGYLESTEIIVVDDGSSDDTQLVLSGLPGLHYHRNLSNLGFIDSCNAGASLASAPRLVFLNNDTLVAPGWLEELESCFSLRSDCGLVGSMLIYPDMRLQEAGGMVYRNGSAGNRGKHRDLGHPDFNHLRTVDYCSGASIMIERHLFEVIGGFDTRYRPAYFEDVDLAFSVRRQGLQVYCQPASKVIHFEGITSGRKTSSGVKAHQVTNRAHFAAKWAEDLAGQPERRAIRSEAPPGRAGRILVIDNQTPRPDRDAGSLLLFNSLRIMVQLGYAVDYLPLRRPQHISGYTALLQREGIRCLYKPYFRGLANYLRRHGPEYDLVFISRIKIIKSSYALVRRFAPGAKVVFNTVDLNFLRVGRRAELEQSPRLARKAEGYRRDELFYLNQADASIIVSPAELELIKDDVDPAKVEIIPLILEFPTRRATYQTSRNLAFIGHFTHAPNVDAMRFFLSEVWPKVKRIMPEVRFDIIGKDFPADLSPLLDEAVTVHGLVPDLDTIFPSIRVCLAPLRFGAGLKGKLVTSLSYAVPSVVSPIAMEGMGLVDGVHALVANTPDQWVQQIQRLYSDEVFWQQISAQGLAFAEREYSMSVNRDRFQRLFSRLQAVPEHL